MKFIKFLFVTLFLIILVPFANAETDLSMFEKVYEPSIPELKKPTVVSVTLPDKEQYGVVIMELENDVPQPWISVEQFEEKLKFNVKDSSVLVGNKNALIDYNYDTVAEFDLDKDNEKAFIEIEGDKKITSSSLKLSLDSHVALPKTIALYAFVDNGWKTIIAKKKLNNTFVTFPKTISKNWKIEFTHVQPLRLREITLIQEDEKNLTGLEIRWLARPGKEYSIYTKARTYPGIKTSEHGKLQGKDLEIIKVTLPVISNNQFFKEQDVDEDKVVDIRDNCINVANTNQEDVDNNGLGDACEDFDGDGIFNIKDNCPEHPNRYQKDTDGDEIGDACDDEESRLTEKNPWLPWLAMGITAFVLFGIVIQTVRNKK